EGLGLELDRAVDLPTLSMMVVIQEPAGGYRSIGVELCDAHKTAEGRLRLNTRFGGFADELLKAENLTPRFQPHTFEFTLRQPAELLEKWVEVGVLTPVLWDRIQVCPRCHGMPRYRKGCRSCGGVRVSNERLIHHFACAHVAPVADFEKGGELVCPKCRMRRMIVASDFEYANGPYRCEDCHWSSTDLEQVAQCLRCDLRFPIFRAHEVELRGYRANRLGPLALLPAPGLAAAVPLGPFADGRAPLRADQAQHVPVALGPQSLARPEC